MAGYISEMSVMVTRRCSEIDKRNEKASFGSVAPPTKDVANEPDQARRGGLARQNEGRRAGDQRRDAL
jgi:hypothetical protein